MENVKKVFMLILGGVVSSCCFANGKLRTVWRSTNDCINIVLKQTTCICIKNSEFHTHQQMQRGILS